MELLYDEFIESHLNMLVDLKYDNFKHHEPDKNTKKNKKKQKFNYYFNNIIINCGVNKNYDIVDKLFMNDKCSKDYFIFIEKKSCLWMLIEYNYSNEFIKKYIDIIGMNCFPQYTYKSDTVLIMCSKKNNIEIFNKILDAFGDEAHPVI